MFSEQVMQVWLLVTQEIRGNSTSNMCQRELTLVRAVDDRRCAVEHAQRRVERGVGSFTHDIDHHRLVVVWQPEEPLRPRNEVQGGSPPGWLAHDRHLPDDDLIQRDHGQGLDE